MSTPENMIEPVSNVTVIGAGVIGMSWTALFLAHGLNVVVHDVAPDAEARVRQGMETLMPTLAAMGLPIYNLCARLSFEPTLAKAVANADFVQENGPDRISFKRALWAEVEQYAPTHTLFLSSSSGIPTKQQGKDMREPGRLLIGHPFNPPHLIPLVEVVAHARTKPDDAQRVLEFYRAVGKKPMLLRKEVPGFVANRLQSALLREAVLMVKWGVVSVDELDDIVTSSIGLRWATGGPFRSFHMGGGPTGFAGFLKHFARGVQLLWLHSKFSPVWFTRRMNEKLLAQVGESFGQTPMAELEAERDQRQIALLRELHGVGKTGDQA
ncbi:MAG: 3-hydroxyacyl-CoA dehydrogenase NAD-binding domain-containing protein [Pseudomonadota bacterium]